MKIKAVQLTLLAALAGCNTGSAPTQSFVAVPYSPDTNTIAVPVNPSGGTLSFPGAGGYGGTFVYSANNGTAADSMTATTIANPPANLVPAGQTPPGTMLVAFEFTLNANVTFSNWKRLLTTITIPPLVPTAGHTFNEYGYDLTANIGEGSSPGTVSGTTIDFGSGFGPVTLLGGHTYLSVLTEQ